jgi:hypothetical protein
MPACHRSVSPPRPVVLEGGATPTFECGYLWIILKIFVRGGFHCCGNRLTSVDRSVRPLKSVSLLQRARKIGPRVKQSDETFDIIETIYGFMDWATG